MSVRFVWPIAWAYLASMGDPREGFPDEFEVLLAAIRLAPAGAYMADDVTIGPEVVRSELVFPTGVEAYVWHIDVERVKTLGRALINSNVRTPLPARNRI